MFPPRPTEFILLQSSSNATSGPQLPLAFPPCCPSGDGRCAKGWVSCIFRPKGHSNVIQLIGPGSAGLGRRVGASCPRWSCHRCLLFRASSLVMFHGSDLSQKKNALISAACVGLSRAPKKRILEFWLPKPGCSRTHSSKLREILLKRLVSNAELASTFMHSKTSHALTCLSLPIVPHSPVSAVHHLLSTAFRKPARDP